MPRVPAGYRAGVPGPLPVLETARLRLRALTLADGDAVARVLGEPRPRWLAWTVASYAQLAELHQPPYGERAVELRGSGELVGLAGFVPCLEPFGLIPELAGAGIPADRFRPEVGLFWATAPEHRGHGYAGEAARGLIDHGFGVLRLGRLVATTEHTNAASIRVMQKLGMTILRAPAEAPWWMQTVAVLDAPAG